MAISLADILERFRETVAREFHFLRAARRFRQEFRVLDAHVLQPAVSGMSMETAPGPVGTNQAPVCALDHPRYNTNPVYLIFESYILDVIGHLPPDESKSVQDIDLQKVFKTKSSEWRQALRETLHLSETIDIAILDLWYRNREIARKQGIEYDPQHFAMDFTDEYIKDGSKVDVWRPGTLEAAKKRISELKTKVANKSSPASFSF